MKLTTVFALGVAILGAPTAAQTLQSPGSLGVEQEGRFDMSARILRDAFSTIDNEISGIFLYPFENPDCGRSGK